MTRNNKLINKPIYKFIIILMSSQIILTSTMGDSGNTTAAAVSSQHYILRRAHLPGIEIQTLELLLAVAFFIVLGSLGQKRRHGLPSWPLIGMLPSLVAGVKKDVYEWVTEVLVRRGGTFTFRGPWCTDLQAVLTADPLNMEYLLKTNSANFPKGAAFLNNLRDLLGDGIFNADGENWRLQRKAAGLEFHSKAFRALTVTSLVELVHSRLLPVLDQAMESNAKIDLQSLLLRLLLQEERRRR